VVLLVLVLLSAGWLLHGLGRAESARHQAETLARSAAALREARFALLGAAVAHGAGDSSATAPGPGRFTCAAPSADLIASCQGGDRSTGFFPRTLDEATRQPLPRFLDGSSTPLVLAMDTRFRKGTPTPIHLGLTPPPQLSLDGAPVVALLFAPGPAMAAVQVGGFQSRLAELPPYGAFAIAQYLEDTENADGDEYGRYVTPGMAASNDLVLAIRHEDLLCAIRPRVKAAREMHDAYTAYLANPSLPASPPPPAWYAAEGWNQPVDGTSGPTRGEELETSPRLDCAGAL
jgi:hypothetical protein